MSPNELTELAPLAATLNEESNELNQTIASLNERIAALNLGISVWSQLLDDDDETGQQYQLGFTAIEVGDKKTWQLAYRQRRRIYDEVHDDPIEDDDVPHFFSPIPVLQTSRNLRIECLDFVPVLLREMKKEAEYKIAAMRKGKEIVAELGAVDPRSARQKGPSANVQLATIPPDVAEGVKKLWPGSRK
ncbi:MAG TPA: hypothetical protein VME18_02520 [Acidobacteriaceae bacterium]|nr:hypothetical protein [Acidobacteriaceae bacterium]